MEKLSPAQLAASTLRLFPCTRNKSSCSKQFPQKAFGPLPRRDVDGAPSLPLAKILPGATVSDTKRPQLYCERQFLRQFEQLFGYYSALLFLHCSSQSCLFLIWLLHDRNQKYIPQNCIDLNKSTRLFSWTVIYWYANLTTVT